MYLATATKNTYSTCCKKHSSFGLKAGNQYAVKFFTKTQAGASNNKEDIIDVSTQVAGLCKVYFYDTLTPYEKDYVREVLGIEQKIYEYCIMEYIDGYDLHDLMVSGKRFMEKEIKFIIKQVLTSLSHLHDMGFCHRDVKLENVIYKHAQHAQHVGPLVDKHAVHTLLLRLTSMLYVRPISTHRQWRSASTCHVMVHLCYHLMDQRMASSTRLRSQRSSSRSVC